jgi:DNA recombination protein RmuC
MAALLNSLQMGFKTLEIQKHSSDVYNLLSAVKAEFESFSAVLASVQKKYNSASDEMTKLVTTRTNAINRKLRNITAMDEEQAKVIFDAEAQYLE